MSHTPGPWKASKLNLNHGVYAANGECICKVDGSVIAEIDRRCAATARLLAAAPQMLIALEVALRQLETLGGTRRPRAAEAKDEIHAVVLEIVDEAIAAARGQA